MPLVGGLAIGAVFLACFGIFRVSGEVSLWFGAAAAIVLACGVLDDYRELGSLAKFGFQILAAWVLAQFGGQRARAPWRIAVGRAPVAGRGGDPVHGVRDRRRDECSQHGRRPGRVGGRPRAGGDGLVRCRRSAGGRRAGALGGLPAVGDSCWPSSASTRRCRGGGTRWFSWGMRVACFSAWCWPGWRSVCRWNLRLRSRRSPPSGSSASRLPTPWR